MNVEVSEAFICHRVQQVTGPDQSRLIDEWKGQLGISLQVVCITHRTSNFTHNPCRELE